MSMECCGLASHSTKSKAMPFQSYFFLRVNFSPDQVVSMAQIL